MVTDVSGQLFGAQPQGPLENSSIFEYTNPQMYYLVELSTDIILNVFKCSIISEDYSFG
jgi:hypothetical protein